LTNEATNLKSRLKQLGLSDAAIDAAWPEWWSNSADSSASARLELRFSIARKLGLDARSLTDEEGVPRFIWRDEARFKNLTGEDDSQRAAIASFGMAFASIVIGATRTDSRSLPNDPSAIRESILSFRPFVSLVDLLLLGWSVGIPVIHLRIFPLLQKRMAAMCVRVGERGAILMGKDSMYPAQIAFYLAHEMAHIALGHLKNQTAIVDLEANRLAGPESDREEIEADRFALQLLTGRPDPQVLPSSDRYNAPGLADAVLRSAESLRIEPGTLALCFGYSTGNWAVVNSAMGFIYSSPKPVWAEINKLAMRELTMEGVPSDSRAYVNSVLGGVSAA
jgi:hypothetical protein